MYLRSNFNREMHPIEMDSIFLFSSNNIYAIGLNNRSKLRVPMNYTPCTAVLNIFTYKFAGAM